MNNPFKALKDKNVLFFVVCVLLLIFFVYYAFAVVPTHGTPLLNSTFGTNGTSENITAYNITTADTESNPVKSIYQWYLNNTPIAVAVLPFEGGSNNTETNDTSPFANNGVVNGGTWANNSGYDGFGAYNFTGIGANNITLIKSPSLNITGNQITLEAWIRPNVSETNYIISKSIAGPTGMQYALFISAGSLRMSLRNSTTTVTTVASGTINTDVWAHVVGTYNETNILLYLDGLRVGAQATFSGNIVSQNSDVRIGEDAGGNSLFNGTIDDVRIYNISLTAEQVLAHYRNRTNTIAGSINLNRTLLRAGDVWNASVTPFDSSGNGTQLFTTSLTILANASPSHDRPILNSTTGVNTTTENITVYNVSTIDPDGDAVKNIFNWYRNNTPIAIVNMPFEGGSNATNTTDYSGRNSVVTINGTSITWNSSAGIDGRGAYDFNGSDSPDFMRFASLPTTMANGFSVVAWIKPKEFDSRYHLIFGNCDNIHFYYTISNGNRIVVSYANSTGQQKSVSTAILSSANIWYHVALTIHPNSTVNLYINGTINASNSLNQGISSTIPSVVTIGNSNTRCGLANYPKFNGTIDEFAFYNMSLTPGQVLALYNNRTNVIDTSMLQIGDTWNASITPNDGGRNGITKISTNLTIVAENTAPTIETPVFNVSTVTKTSGIKANTTYRDVDSNAATIYFTWYRNNSVVFTDNYTSIPATTIVNSTLSVNLYNRTDLINVTVIANDGTVNSSTNFSTTLTVANTAPSAETPVFNVSTVTKTSGIRANTTFRDADRDNGRITFRWFRNNSEIFTENFTNQAVDTIIISNLSVNLYNRTDLLNVTVFADDGNANSSTNFSTTLTVANTAPAVETPVFNVSTVTKTSGIAANTTFRDADRDNARVSFRWFRNNSEIFTENFTGITVNTIVNSTLSVNLYNRTDLINVTAFADDGNANSTTNFSTTLTVANTAPAVETPVFNVSTVTKTSGIAANTTYRDADRDNARVSFRWFRNNSEIFTENITAITTGTIVNSTLSVNLYNRTDLINVTAFADDGNANSTTNFSTTLTVANTAPAVETPVFNVSTVTKTSGIAANTTYRDADRDNARVSFRWFRNNSEIFTENITAITTGTIVNSTLSVNLYNRTDLINVTVFADDGNANSTTNFSTTLTVANTAPSAETPVFNVSTVTKTSGIAVNTTFRDADRDNARVSFRWFRNNSEVFTQNFTGITVDTIVNSTLNVTFYNRTDLINVTTFADDGNANSTTNFSTTLTVANTAPTQGTPILNSTLGFNNTDENLTAFNVSVSDPDNDGITTYYEWFNNSRSVLNTTTNILSTGNLTGDDRWFVQVIASDLIGNSSPINTSNVTINALSITLLTPENASRRNNTNQEFNFNTTIVASTICSLFNNASGAYQNRSSTSSITRLGNNSVNHTSIAEASSIFWNVECISPAGSRIFAPANFSLIIDRTAPNVSKISPVTVTSGQDTTFTATVSDIDSISSCNLFLRGSNVGAMTIAGTTASRIANTSSSSDITVEVYANCTDPLGNINFNRTNVSVTAVRSGGGDVGEGRAPAATTPTAPPEEGLEGGTKYANLEQGSVIFVAPTGIRYPITVKSIYPNSVRLDIGGLFNFILLKETTRSFDLNSDMMDDVVIYVDDVVSYSRVTLTVLERQNAAPVSTTTPTTPFFEDLGAIWEKVIGPQEEEKVQEPVETELEKELAALRQIVADLQSQIQEKEAKIAELEQALLDGTEQTSIEKSVDQESLQRELAQLREEFKALAERLAGLETEEPEQTPKTEAPLEFAVQQQTKIQFQQFLQTSGEMVKNAFATVQQTGSLLRQKGSITGAVAVDVSTDFVVKKVVTSAEMRMLALTIVLIGLVMPMMLGSYTFQRLKKKKRDEIDAHLEKEIRYRGLN